jgi:hypothetical protein
VNNKTLLLLMWFISSSYCMATSELPCVQTELAPVIPLETQDLLAVLYRDRIIEDEQGNRLQFTAQEVIVDEGALVFIGPRLNGQVITSIEHECTEFGVSLFGREICLKSEPRTVENSLCKLLGLASTDQSSFQVEIFRSGDERHMFAVQDSQWASHSTSAIVGPRVSYERTARFTCKI